MALKVPLKERVSAAVALTKDEAEKGVPGVELAIANLLPQIQLALPGSMDAQQMVRDMIQLVRKQPKLVLCEPTSVLGAMMTCAQLGLRPGVPSLGQADILPFWNTKLDVVKNGRATKGGFEAVFVIGYQGMIELINRSGKVGSVAAREVYHGEEFDVEYGSQPRLVHKPNLDGEPGELRGFYSVVTMVNGGTYFEYWPLAKMETHRDRFALAKYKDKSTGKETIVGPWRDHFVAMGKKTMVRQAFKLVPRSTDLTLALSTDNTVRRGDPAKALETLQDLAETVIPVDPDDAGTMPEDEPISGKIVDGVPSDFPVDTSKGAPPAEEQYQIWLKERADNE